MTMAQNPEILNIAEVAALLRCSKAHVCKTIQGRVKGVTRLPAVSMGRRKLVRRASLEAWLAENDHIIGATMVASHKRSP
jgi:excisionase family DNA binding protein